MSEAELREEIGSPPAVLSEERKQELLAYWREVFAGRIQPELLRITPEVEEAVRAKERTFPRRITAAARQSLLTDSALSWHHGGKVVVCLETPAGCAVLAAGAAEFLLFLGSVPSEQRSCVEVTYPGFWEEDAE
jgi:hypothetical protein